MWESSKKINVVGSSLFILVGIWVMAMAVRLNIGGLLEPGPGFFPFLGGFSLTAISLILLLGVLRGRITGSESFRNWRRPAIMYAGCVGYVIIIGTLGFVIATTILSFIVLRMLGGKRWWADILIGFAFSFGSYFLFARLLDVPLPQGLFA
jgi:putative tricarboxylic transport membrane protein